MSWAAPEVSPLAFESQEAVPLLLDLEAVRQGVAAYVQNRGELLVYLTALRGIQLGAQPIVVDGQRAGSFDPLGKRPELARQLAEAQAHGEELAHYLDTLHGWAKGGMAEAVAPILPELEKARDLLAALPSGATPSPEVASTLQAAIYTASIHSWVIGLAARQERAGVIRFLGELQNDYHALSSGATALAEITRQAEADVQDAAQRYLLNPITAPIGRILVQIGAQLLGQLHRLGGALEGALTGHLEMRGGISALASAVESLVAKYEAAQNAVSRASAAELPPVLRKLEPGKAIASWQDFLRFLEKSSL